MFSCRLCDNIPRCLSVACELLRIFCDSYETGLITVGSSIFGQRTLNGFSYTHIKHYKACRQSNVNPFPIAHHYKCRENTNRSHVSQLSKAPIPTSKLKYVPNPMQVYHEIWCDATSKAGSTHEVRAPYLLQAVKIQNSQDHYLSLFCYCKVTRLLINYTSIKSSQEYLLQEIKRK